MFIILSLVLAETSVRKQSVWKQKEPCNGLINLIKIMYAFQVPLCFTASREMRILVLLESTMLLYIALDHHGGGKYTQHTTLCIDTGCHDALAEAEVL